MGLRKVRPLSGDHLEIGALCFLCKLLIQAGDEICHVPQNPDGRESGTLVAHWKCVEDGFNRLRGSESVALGNTRDFLESWAATVKDKAADREFPYASQADFILKHGRGFEWRALPPGIRMGMALQCFRNSVRAALGRPRFYTYVEGYAINTWVARHPVAHAWCIDPEGFVVDTTWDEGMDYFGVPFRMEYVRRIANARKKDYCLIDNEEMGFPLLTGAHAVADALKA